MCVCGGGQLAEKVKVSRTVVGGGQFKSPVGGGHLMGSAGHSNFFTKTSTDISNFSL